MEIAQPPTSLVFSLASGSSCSSTPPCRRPSTLPGRYIQLAGWDSHLGGGGPSPLSHSPFPSLSQRPGPTSCDRKILGRHQKPPGVMGGAPPTPGLESSGVWTRRTSCPRALLWSFPLLAPQHRPALRLSRNEGIPDLPRPS